jgi:hypothetical protein
VGTVSCAQEPVQQAEDSAAGVLEGWLAVSGYRDVNEVAAIVGDDACRVVTGRLECCTVSHESGRAAQADVRLGRQAVHQADELAGSADGQRGGSRQAQGGDPSG